MRIAFATAITLALAPVPAVSFAAPGLGAGPIQVVAKIEVKGGPRAGSYTLERDVQCLLTDRTAPKKRQQFEVLFGTTERDMERYEDPNALNLVGVTIPDVENPKEFYAFVGFGEEGREVSYQVETRADKEKKGSGSVAFAKSGNTATVKLAIHGEGGVEVTGELDCKELLAY
jgi:hypothetical protein